VRVGVLVELGLEQQAARVEVLDDLGVRVLDPQSRELTPALDHASAPVDHLHDR
jgi:hypothetical protein